MNHIGDYAGLDKGCPITIETGSARIEVATADIVKAVLRANYGLHRFLSELVLQAGQQKKPEDATWGPAQETPLIKAIRERLEAGDYQ